MIDRADAMIAWDDDDDPAGNVMHVAEHGLTPGDVESVLLDPDAEEVKSRSSGMPAVRGWTGDSRWIFVVYEVASGNPLVLYPVTAYEPDPQD